MYRVWYSDASRPLLVRFERTRKSRGMRAKMKYFCKYVINYKSKIKISFYHFVRGLIA